MPRKQEKFRECCARGELAKNPDAAKCFLWDQSTYEYTFCGSTGKLRTIHRSAHVCISKNALGNFRISNSTANENYKLEHGDSFRSPIASLCASRQPEPEEENHSLFQPNMVQNYRVKRLTFDGYRWAPARQDVKSNTLNRSWRKLCQDSPLCNIAELRTVPEQ